jgi:hypothetical protein
MHTTGRGIRARLCAAVLVPALTFAACSSGGDDHPSPTPSRSAGRPASPTPIVIGTADVAAWIAIWKASFQRFGDDISAVVRSARNQDFESLRSALQRLPGDAHEAVRKIDDAGAAPPGLRDETRRLRGLIDQASTASSRLGADCLSNPGLPCAADVATLLSIAGQLMDALKPFGVPIDFHINI